MEAPMKLDSNMLSDFLPTGTVTGSTLATVFSSARSAGNKGDNVFAKVESSASKIITKNDYQYALNGIVRNSTSGSTDVVLFTLFAPNSGVIYLIQISETNVISCKKLTGTNV